MLRVFFEKQVDSSRCEVYGYACLGLEGKPKVNLSQMPPTQMPPSSMIPSL